MSAACEIPAIGPHGDDWLPMPGGVDGPDHATDAPAVRHEAIGGGDVESIDPPRRSFLAPPGAIEEDTDMTSGAIPR